MQVMTRKESLEMDPLKIVDDKYFILIYVVRSEIIPRPTTSHTIRK